MIEAVGEFFNSENFMPHGHCFLWQGNIFWLHLISDLGIVTAYFTIPVTLVYIIRKRRDIPFSGLFFLFAAFILLCGTTHAFNIWVMWNPDYAIEGIIKALTAIASVATACAIIKLIPQILRIPAPNELVTINARLTKTSAELERMYKQSEANSESRLQVVVNTVLDGLIIINEHGIIQSFNRSAERIFGYKPEEVIGQNVKMLMPEPYHSEHDGYLQNYISTGNAKVIGIGREVTGRRKDGGIFPMELGVNAMHIEGARMFVGTVRDITARKRADQALALSEERYQLAVEGLSVGIWDWDLITNNLYRSQRFKELMPFTDEEIKNFLDIWKSRLHPDDRTRTVDMLENHIKKQGPFNVEYRLQGRDGSYTWIHAKGQAVWDSTDKPVRMVGSIEDISSRKQTEREIQEYLGALKRSNQELDDFAYIASHDMKEPLRGLSNNAMFLKEDFGDKIGDEGIKRLDRMSYLCERMERLVNDLLYFSRLGRQELAVQPTNLNEIIRDIELMIEGVLHEANAKIRVPEKLPTIVCDLPRITEALRNLITNAIKYNDKPEKWIEIGCLRQEGERVFYVRDNGIGIAQEFYGDVFRIFKRLNDEDDNVKGTGVGLTFVKKIIERHRGRIWIESEMGIGTTFYFTIYEPMGA